MYAPVQLFRGLVISENMSCTVGSVVLRCRPAFFREMGPYIVHHAFQVPDIVILIVRLKLELDISIRYLN